MYRPVVFHTVNTSVWTGFPEMGDGTNISPTICIDGYGINALYRISAK
jgi:peptide/nickel transport system substrate-binding protein